jgi:uncharacterized protein YgiM (DUF1202 family)
MPESAQSKQYARVHPDALNIRSGPSIHDSIVGQLKKDDRVEITGNLGEWCEVKAEKLEGYVVSEYLRPEEDDTGGDVKDNENFLLKILSLLR